MPLHAGQRPPVDGDQTRTVPGQHLTMIDDVSSDRGEETAFCLTLTWTTHRAPSSEPRVGSHPHAHAG